MGEIKSTLELVMERTKHLSYSAEEWQRVKESEAQRRAEALVNRYLAGECDLRDLLEAASEQMTREALQRALREALDLEHASAARALRALRPELEGWAARVEEVAEEYRRRREELARELAARLAERLRQRGIEGSALRVRPEAAPEWEESLARVRAELARRLEELKASI